MKTSFSARTKYLPPSKRSMGGMTRSPSDRQVRTHTPEGSNENAPPRQRNENIAPQRGPPVAPQADGEAWTTVGSRNIEGKLCFKYSIASFSSYFFCRFKFFAVCLIRCTQTLFVFAVSVGTDLTFSNDLFV